MAILNTLYAGQGVSSSGGTITGDLTISGDLTVEGGGGFSYSEVLTGDMAITNTASTVGLTVNQSGAQIALLINQDANARALYIDTQATSASAIHFDAPTQADGNIIFIESADALTTGAAISIDSGGTALASTATGGLVEILHTGDSDTNVNNLLFIQNNDGGSSGTIPLSIDQNANNHSLYINAATGIAASKTIVKMIHDDASAIAGGNIADGTASGGLHIDKTGDNDGTGSFIKLSSNTDGCQSAIAHIQVDDNDADLAFYTDNGGTLTEAMRIDNSQNIGIGEAVPLGKLHIKTADCGASVTAHGDELVVEGSARSGISILSGNTSKGGLYFADDGANDIGAIRYDHNDNSLEFITNGTGDRIRITSAGNVGIGTATSPHGGVGAAKLSIEGTDGSTAGPHVQYTTAADDYPLFQQLNWTHDAIYLLFDAYWDGAWKSSDAGSNFMINKSSDSLQFQCDTGISVGSGVTWATKFKLDDNSRISLSNNDSAGDSGDGTGTTANTIFGYTAGNAIASGGFHNSFFGHKAGLLMTTGDYNTAIGSDSFKAADGAEANNAFVGYYAGADVTGDTSEGNIGLGYSAFRGGSGAAIGNIAIGRSALDATGSNAQTGTIAIGYNALTALTTGARNLAIGHNAMQHADTATDCIAIGFQAMYDQNVGGSGHAADSDHNIAIGSNSMSGAWADAKTEYNVAIGSNTMNAIMSGAEYNTSIGFESLGGLTSGDYNTAVGANALNAITGGTGNVGVGQSALSLTQGGNSNIAIGGYDGTTVAAMRNNVSASQCVGIGTGALGGVTTQDGTVGVGYKALLALTSGASNTAVGYTALAAEDAGSHNTAVGYQSLPVCNNDTGSNTAVGKGSGLIVVAGYSNTLIGRGAGDIITGGYKNTMIGTNANPSVAGGINQTAIGVDSTGVADNSVTLGDGNVTAVYMAEDSGATVHAGGANIYTYSTTAATTATLNLARSNNGTQGTHTAVDSNDFLGQINFQGSDSNSFETGASIKSKAVETFVDGSEFGSVLSFYTTDVGTAVLDERIRIDHNGYVGIGAAASNPAGQLHCSRAGSTATDNILYIEDTQASADAGDVMVRLDYSNDADVHSVLAKFISFHDSGGEIGYIATSSDGVISSSILSDVRLKTDIKDTSIDGLNIINALKIRDFKWGDKANSNKIGKQIVGGFVADEVYEVYPQAVHGKPGQMKTEVTPATEDVPEKTEEVINPMGVSSGEFISVMMKAIQELSAKVEALENK